MLEVIFVGVDGTCNDAAVKDSGYQFATSQASAAKPRLGRDWRDGGDRIFLSDL